MDLDENGAVRAIFGKRLKSCIQYVDQSCDESITVCRVENNFELW
eukprot:gene12042-25237_t